MLIFSLGREGILWRWTSTVVEFSMFDGSTLPLDASLLDVNNVYTFTVNAYGTWSNVDYGSDTIRVTIIPTPIEVDILGGNRRINQKSDLVLDSSISYNPDRV